MIAPAIRLDLLRPRLRLVPAVPSKNARHGGNRTGEKDAGNVVAKTTRKKDARNEWEAILEQEGHGLVEPQARHDSFDENRQAPARLGLDAPKLCGDELREVTQTLARTHLEKSIGRKLTANDLTYFRGFVRSKGAEGERLERESFAWDAHNRLLTGLRDSRKVVEDWRRAMNEARRQGTVENFGIWARKIHDVLRILQLEDRALDDLWSPRNLGERPAGQSSRRLLVQKFERPGIIRDHDYTATDRDIAAISILGGNWPENIRPSEPLDADSAFAIEAAAIKKARQRVEKSLTDWRNSHGSKSPTKTKGRPKKKGTP